ncbi:MAG: hypothetical protein JRJ54_05820 [Deltaproteobacteria bacterium]|nr:hypothetical protein [Deltaproteobacteria bacterium]
MRSFRATQNLMAVSAAAKETAINTPQTLDLSLLVAMEDVLNIEQRRENNADELTGKEEPDTVYDLGGMAAGNFTFNKAQPQHFAFLLAYALGSISTAAAGTGYQHTLTPMSGDEDADRSLPSFTAAQRYGQTVLKRRFSSMFVDSFTATFAKDAWVKLTAALKGTGKVDSNIVEETVSALDNATQLTLAANAVQGADAQTRLDNVQRIRAYYDGAWREVTYTAVSADTPAVITITSLGGGGVQSIDYKVLYIPTEAAWATFPSRVVETPLRVAQMTLIMGGTWDGSAFNGGRELSAELSSVEWSYQNGLEIEFVPGAGDTYAARCFRPARSQTLKLNREFRENILQQHIADNDTFGFYVLAEGAVYDSPHKYQVELIFPKVGVLTSPISVDGKRLAEAGDLAVLQDDTYGSVIAKVKNLQSAYAA